MGIQFVLTVPAALASSLIMALQPKTNLWLTFFSITVALADVLFLGTIQSRLRKRGATVQQMFDCTLYGLPWRQLRCGPPVDSEDIIEDAKAYLRHQKSRQRLLDWYPAAVKALPLYLARLVCQRASLRWDLRQRDRVRGALTLLLSVLAVAILTIALLRGNESATAARDGRLELSGNLKAVGDTLNRQIEALTQTNDQKLESLRGAMEQRLTTIQEDSSLKLEKIRGDSTSAAQSAREEVTAALKGFSESTENTLNDLGTNQRTQLSDVVGQLTKLTAATESKLDVQKTAIDERLKQIQTEGITTSKQLRDEVGGTLKSFNDSVLKNLTGMAEGQQRQLAGFSEQIGKLTESNQQHLDGLKDSVEAKLKSIQEDNAKQLDQMRATVDEKLQGTLEKRLGESFKLVSDRLEQVYKGLGEMQNLALGVGDLKKVLTNVKTRGTWAEFQLGAMLEQVLSPDQYAANVATKDEGERVEFAIKFPGRGEDKEDIVWLPIDAKFPVEDYQRLVEAQEKADPEAAEQAARQLENRIKQCAKDISEKYIAPPKTTDLAILYLPTEGLFAEATRRVGLSEYLQRQYRVAIAGPTTLWAVLNGLQMGFRTLAIQKRASEVWRVLGAVKTEFGKFGILLDGVKKKIDSASVTIEDAARKSRTIERKLRSVEELPAAEAKTVLQIDSEDVELVSETAQEAGNPAKL